MADIFDTISSEKPKDIFDEITTPEEQTFHGATAGMTFPYKGTPGIGLKPGERTLGGETGAAVTRGGLEVGAGLIGTLKSFSELARQQSIYRPLQTKEEDIVTKKLETATEKIRTAQEKYPRTWEGPGGWALNVVGEAIPYMGSALAGGYIAGPIGAATVGFSVEGQQAYESAIKSGATEEQANTERVIVGSLNAAIEALQIGQLMKFHSAGKHSIIAFKDLIKKKAYRELAKAGGKFTKDVLKNAISETIEEFSQEGVSMAVPATLRKDYPKTPEGKPDWWAIGERLGAAALGGFTAGGILSAGGAVTLATPTIAGPSVEQIESVAKEVQDNPKLGEIEKARLINDLKDLLPAEHPAKTERQFPAGTVNVYRGKESGKIYPETPEGGQTKMVQVEKKKPVYRQVANDELYWLTQTEGKRLPAGLEGKEIFVAGDKSLAIGQGKNAKGPIIEYDANQLNIQETQHKPGLEFVSQQLGAPAEGIIQLQGLKEPGYENLGTSPKQLYNAIKSITFTPEQIKQKDSSQSFGLIYNRLILSNKWAKEKLSNGDIRLVKKEPKTPEIVKKIISKFPQKIKTQDDLVKFTKGVLKELGLEYVAPNISIGLRKNPNGRGIRGYNERGKIFIEVGGKPYKTKSGELKYPSQGRLKKIVLHEIGHSALNQIEGEWSTEGGHFPEFVDWVKEKSSVLFEEKVQKAEVKTEPETKIVATDTGEELELDTELSAQAYEEAKQPPSIFDIPEATQEALNAAKKLAGTLTDIEIQRKELTEKITKKRGIVWKIEEELINKLAPEQGHILARRKGMRFAKQKLREVVPGLTEVLSSDEREALQRTINETTWLHGGEKNNLSSALHQILDEGLPPKRSSVRLFDKFFGTNIIAAAAKKTPKGFWGGAKYWSNEVLSVPIALMTSAEQSFGLIQGFPMLAIQPKTWAKGIYEGARSTLSNKWMRLAEINTKLHPLYNDVVNRGGLDLTEIGDHYKSEEEFRSQLAHRIPIIGKLVAASERGFVAGMNRMRSQYVYNWLELMDGQDISDARLRELCDHAGNITGRAKGKKRGWFEKHMDVWSILTWAPRLYGSWFKTVSDPFFKSGEMRRIAAHDLARIAALVSSTLLLASIAYPEDRVEQSPFSTDFGKIISKDGKQHINLLGPAGQIIRFVSQMIFGMKKSHSTGRIYKTPRLDILARFLRGKQSWAGGIATDVITGKTFLGKQMDLTDPEFAAGYITNHVTPMFYQDIVDAIRFQGLDNASPFSVAYGVWGGGVATYDVTPKKEETDFKNRLAHEYFGTDWDNLGEQAQTMLRKSRPMIEEFERATRFERDDITYRGAIAQDELNAGNRVEHKLPRNVRNELESAQVRVGQLKRYSGHGWYLNDRRYNQFQELLTERLNKVLSNVVKSPGWSERHPSYRQAVLEQVIKDLKKGVWKEVVAQANAEDFKRKEELFNERETTVAAE